MRAADPAGLWAEQLEATWQHSPPIRSQLHGIVLSAMQHGKVGGGAVILQERRPLQLWQNPLHSSCLHAAHKHGPNAQQRAAGAWEQRMQGYQCALGHGAAEVTTSSASGARQSWQWLSSGSCTSTSWTFSRAFNSVGHAAL